MQGSTNVAGAGSAGATDVQGSTNVAGAGSAGATGVRRLPSPDMLGRISVAGGRTPGATELLAELQRLANGNALATLTPTLDRTFPTRSTDYIPVVVSQWERENPAPSPNAPLPLGMGFTAFWLGRLRKGGYGYTLESRK